MFVLSDSTASELSRLIDERGGSGVGRQRGNGVRQLCYVRCISWNTSTSRGTCVVTEFNASSSAWTDFGASADTILLSAQSTALTVGLRYLAVRYGQAGASPPYSAGQAVFVAFPSSTFPYYYPGCGLKFDSGTAGNRISVDLENIKGQGLFINSSGTCPTIGIDPGCHVTLEGGAKVGVLADGLAGCGLTASGSPCKSLNVNNTVLAGNGLVPGAGCSLDVNPGCGVEVVADAVRVRRADLLGAGLYPGAGTCALAVYPGCGVKLDGGKVAVDLDNIKGQGLRVFPGTGGACPTIGIQPGCGITLEGGDKVGVQPSDIAGCGLKAGTGCKIDIDTAQVSAYSFSAVTSVQLLPQAYGCGFTLRVAVTPFELRTNSCGVVVGFVPGTTFISTSDVTVPISRCTALCSYCQGYATYGTGGTPGGVGNCWDGTKWVACATVSVLAMMSPPVI